MAKLAVPPVERFAWKNQLALQDYRRASKAAVPLIPKIAGTITENINDQPLAECRQEFSAGSVGVEKHQYQHAFG